MAVHWLYIQTVVIWGASLGGLNLIRRQADIEALVQFNRLIELFMVFAGWLFKRFSCGSGSGRRLVLVMVVWFWQRLSGSGNGRLVLVTVVWFWRQSSPTCLPACLCQCPI